MSKDYEKAKELGLTSKDRWEEGLHHHPKSVQVLDFLREHDAKDYQDSFDWNVGGDGDNGETLMYQLDAFFELKDSENQDRIEVARELDNMRRDSNFLEMEEVILLKRASEILKGI